MKRLSAPDRTREERRALIDGNLGTATGRSDLVHLALRLIVEEALEGEVADAVGRERGGGLPDRLSAREDQDGGGDGRIRGTAGA